MLQFHVIFCYDNDLKFVNLITNQIDFVVDVRLSSV
jgi:hypothetical protein